MTLALETLRCDHCRRQFDLGLHHYWGMRFCCRACMTAYKRRLTYETRWKIRHIDSIAASARDGVMRPGD
jgi:hypothetical protein